MQDNILQQNPFFLLSLCITLIYCIIYIGIKFLTVSIEGFISIAMYYSIQSYWLLLGTLLIKVLRQLIAQMNEEFCLQVSLNLF